MKKLVEFARQVPDFGRRVMTEIGLAVIDAIFDSAPPSSFAYKVPRQGAVEARAPKHPEHSRKAPCHVRIPSKMRELSPHSPRTP